MTIPSSRDADVLFETIKEVLLTARRKVNAQEMTVLLATKASSC